LGASCPEDPKNLRCTELAIAQPALAWFACEECVDGELQGVLDLGPKVVPALANALLCGPSVEDRLRVESDLQLRYRELSSFASQTPGTLFTLDQNAFVRLYRANYVARVQGRAAWALGKLDDPKAEQALRKGLGADLRADVRQGVEAALKRRSTAR
jgi:HEAT repeat protein